MGKLCSLFIAEKLSLLTLVHPRLYKLQWLSEKDEMVVDRQVTLGKYRDEILCDMVSIEAIHILLEREPDMNMEREVIEMLIRFKEHGTKVERVP
ncbi:hypothetical protein CR513_60268, partial [Mucuna pruriens]